MSAWERARKIPWDRIPQDGSNLEEQRDRILGELQREAIEDELRSQERHHAVPVVESEAEAATTASNYRFKTKIPFSTMELLRMGAFGATIGSVTGAVFGFMDGMRTAQESTVLLNASNVAKSRFILQGTTRSAALFCGFFGSFQMVKYGIRVTVDPGEVAETTLAGVVSLGAFMYRPAFRASLPYATMLVIMDGVQIFMKRP